MRVWIKLVLAGAALLAAIFFWCGCAHEDAGGYASRSPAADALKAFPFDDLDDPTAEPKEPPPEGVRYLAQADSLAELRRQTKADLAWVDDDGAAIFCWVKLAPDGKSGTFTLDQAHQVLQRGRIVWCFFDPACQDGLEFQTPLRQFFVLKFDRAEIKFPGDYGDGNNSAAALLSTNAEGGAVYKVTYCSEGGFRASQEQIRTYLIHVSKDGKYALATQDLGHEGSYPHGSLGASDQFELNVVWKASPAPAPFEVKVRRSQMEYVTVETESNVPDYTSYHDGVLTGPFPMQLKMDPTEYAESDGKLTLAALVDALVFYNVEWFNADWLKPAEQATAKTEVTQAVLTELLRLNPGLDPRQPLAAGTRIILPANFEFEDPVFEKYRLAHFGP